MSDRRVEGGAPEPTTPQPSTWLHRCGQLIRRLLAWMFWVIVIFGLALRASIRDQIHPLAFLFYLTPIPSLAIWMVLAELVSPDGLIRTRKRPAQWFTRDLSPAVSRVALTATFLAWTFGSECVRRDRPIKSPEYRTAFWNVAHGYSGLDRVCAKLKSMDLQAFGLVEADQHYILDLDRWRREFPEYDVVGTDFGGVFAVRGTIVSHQLHDLSSYSFCEEIALRMGNLELMVLLVDIASDLKRPREIPLRNLATLANTFGDRPLIIMGDFNTPDDSCWTAPLRANHHQAFRQRGTGYAATWPLPLPVLTLDQVWTNSQVEVSRCQNLWTFDSDHRPVVTSFSIPN